MSVHNFNIRIKNKILEKKKKLLYNIVLQAVFYQQNAPRSKPCTGRPLHMKGRLREVIKHPKAKYLHQQCEAFSLQRMG